jgi:lipopolysaccharide exporter
LENIEKNTWFGIKWTAAASVFQMLAQMAQLLLISKFLGPTRYGEAILALIAVRTMMPFSAAGIATVLVQEEELPQNQLSSLFWCNLLFSIVIYIVLFFFAPLISLLFELPNLSFFIQISALSILINAFGNIYNALLIKYLAFETTSKITFISVFFDLVISLLVTYIGWYVWSLLLGFLGRVIVSVILQIYFGKKYFSPTFHFKTKEIKGVLSKCFFDMVAQFTNMICTNIDNFLVGKYFGITNLGYYVLAWDLAMKPVYAIVPIFTKVKFPIWAKLKNTPKLLAKDYENTVFRIMQAMCMVFGIWFLVSTYFVPFWYGAAWLPMLEYLHILIFLGIARSFGSPSSYLGMALGFFKQEFYFNVNQLLIYLIVLPLTIFYTHALPYFCYAVLFCYFINDLLWYWFLHKNTNIDFLRLGKKVFLWIFLPLLGVFFLSKFIPLLPILVLVV